MRQIKRQLRLALRLWMARALGRDRDQKLADDYFSTDDPKKLHLGCGRRILPGWLNADLYPKTRDVLHLDARDTLPFPDGAFDYAFTEHVIEHLDFVTGQKVIDELHRILAPDGALRISTPDLAFLIEMWRPDKTPMQHKFLEHFMSTEFENPQEEAPTGEDVFLINRYVRAWGHLFIYDEKTLRFALERAGFASIVRVEVGQSGDPSLRSLEHEQRKPPGLIALESMVLEASKAERAGRRS